MVHKRELFPLKPIASDIRVPASQETMPMKRVSDGGVYSWNRGGIAIFWTAELCMSGWVWADGAGYVRDEGHMVLRNPEVL